ncbi:MAG: DUF4410 domain-containing protein [Candidatus Binatia bacterium]
MKKTFINTAWTIWTVLTPSIRTGSQRDLLLACSVALALWGCARTVVKPQQESVPEGFSRPTRILVYDFVVSESEVTENEGVLAQIRSRGSSSTESEREFDIGRQAAGAYAEDLVSGIRAFGLPAERAQPGMPIVSNTLLINGQFLNVDEGNRLRRVVIGFGAGSSRVDSRVQVYYVTGTEQRKLLEFTTHADSGQMPGAAATMGVGAAAQGGVTAGMAAANAAVGGAKVNRSGVENMAGRSAQEAVAYLSEYFAKQGWISADAVKKAKRAEE